MDRVIDASVIRRRRGARAATGIAIVAGAGLLLFLLPGWIRPGVSRGQIRTGRVSRGTLETAVQATGVAVPAFEMAMSSPVEARVERIRKRAGDRVRIGEEVYVLDTSASRLEVERIEQRLALKLNEEAAQRLSLEEVSRDMAGQAESRKLDLQILRYREGQTLSLYQAGLASEQSLREAEVAASKAVIELTQVESAAEHARKSTDVRLAGLALEVATLRKELEESRRQLLLATTRSEADGVLTWTVPQEGVTVRRGEVIARIADLSSFRVEATVSDVHADRLRVGQPVRVLVDERSLAGHVLSISPAIENGTQRFQVELDEPSTAPLRQNLRVDVLALTESRDDTLMVPRGPFAQGGAIQQVFVIRENEAVRRRARFGTVGWEAYEILEGLSEGDEVILSDMSAYLYAERIRIR